MQFDVGLGEYFEEEEEFESEQYDYDEESEEPSRDPSREPLVFDREAYSKDEIIRLRTQIQDERRQERYGPYRMVCKHFCVEYFDKL